MKKKRNLLASRKYILLRTGSIFIFLFVFIIIGTGYALLNTQLEIIGKSTIIQNEVDSNKIIRSNSIVEWKTNNLSGNVYNLKINVTNNDQEYDLWKICFDVPEKIASAKVNNLGDVKTTISENNITIKKIVNDDFSYWKLGETKIIDIELSFYSNVILDVSNVYLNNQIITNIKCVNNKKLQNSTKKNKNEENAINNIENNTIIEENNIKNNQIKNNVINNDNNILEENTIDNIGYENEINSTGNDIINSVSDNQN